MSVGLWAHVLKLHLIRTDLIRMDLHSIKSEPLEKPLDQFCLLLRGKSSLRMWKKYNWKKNKTLLGAGISSSMTYPGEKQHTSSTLRCNIVFSYPSHCPLAFPFIISIMTVSYYAIWLMSHCAVSLMPLNVTLMAKKMFLSPQHRQTLLTVSDGQWGQHYLCAQIPGWKQGAGARMMLCISEKKSLQGAV